VVTLQTIKEHRVELERLTESRRKKLNKIEKLKQNRTPEEALAQLESYAKNGYDSIPKEDLDFFLKSFGIFDRKEPNSFMMRVRISGGKLTSEQAKVVGEVARDFGNDYIDITTRMQIQLRYLKIEDIPTVISKLESVGITSFQTGVDNIRNIVVDPLSGVAKDSIFETDSLVQSMEDIFLKKSEWISSLPRKFNVGINPSFSNRSNIFGHDFSLVLAKKGGQYGYNLYLGGKVGETAKQTDIFLRDRDEVLEVFETTLKLFRKYGFRDNRNRNRLFYLLETIGVDKFVETIRKEAKSDFLSSGESCVSVESSGDETVPLYNENYAKLIVVPSGIFSGSRLLEFGEFLERYSGEIRFTYQQNFYLVNIPKESLKEELIQQNLLYENRYFRNMVACAGSKDCPFGIIEGKPDAINMANYLTEKLGNGDSPISFHWSACPKGCGIHGFGDFGFEGTKTKVDGETIPAVHISIGGELIGDGKEGRKILKSIPLTDAKLYTYDLVQIYEEMREPFETFSKFQKRVLQHYSSEAIEFILRFNRMFPKMENIRFSPNPTSGKVELFEIFSFGVQIYKTIAGENPYEEIRNFTTICETKPHKINSKISPVVLGMVEKEFGNRYQVFSEVMTDLEKLG
jgi:ferredoxin-nitrite reductase